MTRDPTFVSYYCSCGIVACTNLLALWGMFFIPLTKSQHWKHKGPILQKILLQRNFWEGTLSSCQELQSTTRVQKQEWERRQSQNIRLLTYLLSSFFRFPAFILIVNGICDCFIILPGCGINGDGEGSPRELVLEQIKAAYPSCPLQGQQWCWVRNMENAHNFQISSCRWEMPQSGGWVQIIVLSLPLWSYLLGICLIAL